jgi:NitT/TauT family transport system substrate-binding protein
MRAAIYACICAFLAMLGSAAPSQAVETVTVCAIPIVDMAPIYLGKKKGFFEKHGLNIEFQTGQGGAALVPMVVSGQCQFGFSNLMSLLAATSRGLDLKIVAAGVSSTGKQGDDFSAIVVPGDSPAKTMKDLEGKTVALNTLRNMGEVSVGASMRKVGGDPDKLHYVEIAFPDAPAAIANKSVDAAWVVEPFLTIAKNQGARVIASNIVDLSPKMMMAVYFAAAAYIAQNPSIVKDFTAALQESLDYADAHHDEVRSIVPTYTKISPEVAATMVIPSWSKTIDEGSIKVMAEGAVQVGLLKTEPDISKILPQ